MNGKWSLRKKENGFVLFVNGQEAVDIFNKKLGFVTTIQPGKDSSQIWVSFFFFFSFFFLSLLNATSIEQRTGPKVQVRI